MARPAGGPGITGELSELYDVFVDWPGRLARELPGLRAQLGALGARRVLDVGCGTGQHVAALLAEGLDAHGADVSEDMLARARAAGVPGARLHRWRLGDEPPDALRALAPFDAVLALGNVWPMLVTPYDLAAAGRALHALLRPGGRFVAGLKAFEARRASGQPYLPLLRRAHAGRTLWFVRFVDFEVAPVEGVRTCDLHMTVVAGTADEPAPEVLLHRATRVRSWSAAELARWLDSAGFTDVRVGGSLTDPALPATGEDVFAVAERPGARARRP
ncbi:MAG TPA: methyltransferase [Planctomycetota bacterium]